MDSTANTFDVFICVHRRDVDYLLELVLRSFQVNFVPKGKLYLITNDLPYLRDFVDRLEMDTPPTLFSDDECLSQKERELPGWYRQQVIKLRAHEFCETAQFCNLGADTLLLQPITEGDLISDGFPIIYYTAHRLPVTHFWFERARVFNVARILNVNPTRAQRYTDFINDLFCFDKACLVSLNEMLCNLYGTDYYYTLLRDLKTTPAEQNRFGEWTLYSVYVLDCLNRSVTLRNTRNGFLYQLHSKRWLPFYRFNTKVAHLVAKDFDVQYIKRRIHNHGLELGKFL